MLGGDGIETDGRLGIGGGMGGVSAIAMDMALRFNSSGMGGKYI